MSNKSNDKKIPSIKTEFYKIIEIEINSLKSSLVLQKYMQTTISSISNRLWNKINSSYDIDLIHNTSKNLYEISNFAQELQNNINCLENLKEKLENLYSSINNINSNQFFFDKVKKCHLKAEESINKSLNFNSIFNDFMENFSEINNLSQVENTFSINNTIPSKDTNVQTSTLEKISKEDFNKETIIKKIEKTKPLIFPDNIKENTLIITNLEIILPFTKKDIEEKFETTELSSYEEIIDAFYKKSAKSFEHSAISRFKEAYSLIVNKEHGSKLQALTLGLELSTNYNLHPAIIAACKNLTQLDVYLSCLEYKELADFRFFDIVYNIPPMPSKNIFKKTLETIQASKVKIFK